MYLFLLIHLFWPVESKSDVHFRRPEHENLYNPEKTIFPNYRELVTRLTEMDTGFRFYRSKKKKKKLKSVFNPFNSRYPENSEWIIKNVMQLT